MTLGFYFDAAKCMGCRTCQIACKDKNDLELGAVYRKMHSYEVGAYPDATLYHYSWSCNHCAMPECVANCPTGAMFIAEDGTVQHDDEKCIGCETCVKSCPYGVPLLREEKGVAGKCDSCADLRSKGKNPACVDACLMRCLDFGDVDELKARYGKDVVQDLPILPASDRTKPATIIHAKDAMTLNDFTEIEI